MIRLATKEDLTNIMLVYMKARKFMKDTGNPDQWGDNRPTYESVVTDIDQKRMYIIEEDEGLLGVFSLYDYDKDYEDIDGKWLNDEPYVAIHKLAANGMKNGVFKKALDFAKTRSNNIRIDTHKHNKVMQLNIKRNKFSYVGRVYIDGELERLAYHLVV